LYSNIQIFSSGFSADNTTANLASYVIYGKFSEGKNSVVTSASGTGWRVYEECA